MVATNGVSVTALDTRQVKIRVLGTTDLNRRVRASVFASKLAALVKAVEAADKSANGTKTFEFVIADLKPSSAMAVIEERRVTRTVPQHSSVDTFGRCLISIDTGRFEFARRHMECTRQIAVIAKDVTKTFEGAELTVNGFETVLVNPPFLSKVAEAISVPETETKEWFKGVTLGSLDGTIITESIETGATTMALRLSVGDDIRVDCECPSFTSADIAPFFGKRVRVSGRIFYKGDTGLPYKVELLEIPRLVKSDPDFLRWEGAFRPSDEAQGWDS